MDIETRRQIAASLRATAEAISARASTAEAVITIEGITPLLPSLVGAARAALGDSNLAQRVARVHGVERARAWHDKKEAQKFLSAAKKALAKEGRGLGQNTAKELERLKEFVEAMEKLVSMFDEDHVVEIVRHKMPVIVSEPSRLTSVFEKLSEVVSEAMSGDIKGIKSFTIDFKEHKK